MEKKNFNALEIEVISFNQADIIRMSDGVAGDGDGGLPTEPDFG